MIYREYSYLFSEGVVLIVLSIFRSRGVVFLFVKALGLFAYVLEVGFE